MFREKLDESIISFAIVGFSTKVDGKFTWHSLNDSLLRRARFDGDLICGHGIIIPVTMVF